MVGRLGVVGLAFAVAVAGSVILYPADHASACFVARGPNPSRGAIAAADIAFIGKSIAERPLGPDDSWPHESTLHVLSYVKGHVDSEVVLSPLPFHESDCRRGPRLPVGTTALVLMDDSYEPGRPYGLDIYDLDKMSAGKRLPAHFVALLAIIVVTTTAGILAQVWTGRRGANPRRRSLP
jgi:hypothetical protein